MLFFAVKLSLSHSISKIPSNTTILPKLSLSSSSGSDFMASLLELILNVFPLNSNRPSTSIAVLIGFIIYSPFDGSKVTEVWYPPFITFLQSPYSVKMSSFLKYTILLLLIWISEHPLSVVFSFSKSLIIVFSKILMWISSKSFKIIIYDFLVEDNLKFTKLRVTELDVIIAFPSSDFPVT